MTPAGTDLRVVADGPLGDPPGGSPGAGFHHHFQPRTLRVRLGDHPGPSWTTNGRRLVYAADVLQIVGVDGTGYRTIDPCAPR